MRSLLTDTACRAHEATGPKSLGVDIFNLGVVGNLLPEVAQFGCHRFLNLAAERKEGHCRKERSFRWNGLQRRRRFRMT